MACPPHYIDPAVQRELDELRRRINEIEQAGRSTHVAGGCRLGGVCVYPKAWNATVPPACRRCGLVGPSSLVTIVCKGGVE